MRRPPQTPADVIPRSAARLRFSQRAALSTLTLSVVISHLSMKAYAQVSLQISSRSERVITQGLRHVTLRTSSPANDADVVFVDLCAPGVRLEATNDTTSLQTAGAWGSSVGAKVAINADFYKTGPLRVYGDAIGRGGPWVSSHTGRGTQYSAEWYFERYGWLSAMPGGLTFTHTGRVKRLFAQGQLGLGLSELGGEAPTNARPASPFDSFALVSGFPELVTEGRVHTCADPSATSCFPDRSDMADRHPRSAIGITEDRRTLILLTVDGRSSRSAGVRGAELAWLMGQMGAWQAFNYDGGGSSQLWVQGEGYLNAASSNNGGAVRSVANHLGVVIAPNEGAIHCPDTSRQAPPACPMLPPEGGEISESGPCARQLGERQYWRSLNSGRGGDALWTNAWEHWAPGNWAEWALNPSEAGEYEVEVYLAGEPRHAEARYVIYADGQEHTITVDQGDEAAGHWLSLGVFEFNVGGGQWLRLYDNERAAPSEPRRLYIDSARLTRIAPPPPPEGGAEGGAEAGAEPIAGEPLAGESAGEPIAGEGAGEPLAGEGAGEPLAGESAGEPLAGEGAGEPLAGEGAGEPLAGESAGEPLAGEGAGEPLVGERFDGGLAGEPLEPEEERAPYPWEQEQRQASGAACDQPARSPLSPRQLPSTLLMALLMLRWALKRAQRKA